MPDVDLGLERCSDRIREMVSTSRSMSCMSLGDKPRLSNLLDSVHFPGWYKDADGGLCVIYKDHLVSIRFDEASSQYHVCADILSPHGLWDKNVCWDVTYDIVEAKSYAMLIIKELASAGVIKGELKLHAAQDGGMYNYGK